MEDAVKRPYRSTLRAERAAATREAIRAAAASAFLERGFAATTMREVAERAGVGERTLYDAFPSKLALYDQVVGVAIVGDDPLPVPAAERPEFRAALTQRDGRRAVALYAEYVAALLERAGPLVMVAVESAGAEPELRRRNDEGAAATRANTRAFVDALSDHGVLAGDPDRAAASVFALSSPNVHQLLRVHSGLTAARYRRWLEEALAALLLAAPVGTGDPPVR